MLGSLAMSSAWIILNERRVIHGVGLDHVCISSPCSGVVLWRAGQRLVWIMVIPFVVNPLIATGGARDLISLWGLSL